jgi:predicted TIM-barrel fold metal-dependent hydrolase
LIVDSHIHVGAWDHPDFLGRACTLAQAAAVLEAAGVAGAGIMPTDRCDNAGLLAEARGLAAGPRWWMFAWVQPIAEGGPGRAQLDWAEANAGSLVGLKIHPSLSRVRISDPGFADALALAEARDLIVLVHCGRWQEMASYRFAIEAARRHPAVRFLLAHGGGDTPPLATAAAELVLEHRLENVWFEFSGVREYWVIERNVRRLGAERYLMGSDYSLAHPLMYIGAVRGMALAEAERDRILGGNALALFGDRAVV